MQKQTPDFCATSHFPLPVSLDEFKPFHLIKLSALEEENKFSPFFTAEEIEIWETRLEMHRLREENSGGNGTGWSV